MDNKNKLNLRPVKFDDCLLLYTWANEEGVRKNAFISEPIKYEDHILWFQNKLNASSGVYIFILENMNMPIGQIRFDLIHDVEYFYQIDYSITVENQNNGFGTKIIALGLLELIKKQVDCNIIRALVKADNVASVKCFLRNKFKIIYKDMELVKLEFKLNEFLNE
ncbi:GNAT family N-acetyltransferase [Leptospira noguchii]|uniref:GNAT family N-acetyltransferase n=1 Tax=Leptospira noguchii TaxID=28182 RepID=UPI00068540D1|nr:GNAT family N-acetyltransferase [Leptospira noguchii]UOG47558.1 GNAT family N-acetyltransferase [Leptospira noguchii]